MNVISHFVRCGQMSDSTVCPSKFFSISSFSKINLKLRWDQWVLIALLLTLWIIKKIKACITIGNNSGQSTLVFIRTRPNQWLINKIYFRIGLYSLASVHNGNPSSGTIFVPEEDCSAALLKVEHIVSDRSSKRSGPSLNTLVRVKLTTGLLIGEFEATIAGSRFNPNTTQCSLFSHAF